MASRWVSAQLSFDASGKPSASRKSRTGSERASARSSLGKRWAERADAPTLNDSDPHDKTADEHIVFGAGHNRGC